MNLKTTLLLVTQITLLSLLTSCGGTTDEAVEEEVIVDDGGSDDDSDDGSGDDSDDGSDDDSYEDIEFTTSYFITPNSHEESTDYQWDTNEEVLVELSGDSISVTGSGATVDDSTLLISAIGSYRLTGDLYDGQIIVETEDDGIVRIILDNANITNSTNAPINIQNADKTIVVLSSGTTNTLTDASEYVYEADEDEPNAALFSKDDLTITGEGSLTVNANYNDGITSKDGLVINSGNITVIAKDDGIRGKDYLIINDGNITVDAEGDGFKSDEEDEGKGYISIVNGTFVLTAGADAIQAKSNIQISNGDFTLSSGGGSSANISSDDSAKGLKATVNIFIENGEFIIDSADDAIHSNMGITLNGGNYTLASGDDGIHADIGIEINDGDINITKSYEGIESEVIVINAGDIHLVASDDGINVAGGADGSGFTPGGGGNSDYYLEINGGYIVVNASGDGLDSNGNIDMSGGTVLVNGPTGNGNGPLDYDGSFDISGGLLIAVGSSGMAQAPSSASSQYWLGLNLGTTESAGQLIHIKNTDGTDIVTFAPEKNYQSVVFSSSELDSNESYELYLGGSSTGTETDGLYDGGDYTGGSLTYTFSAN